MSNSKVPFDFEAEARAEERSKRRKLVAKVLLNLFIFALPFFQPGLIFVTLLYVFVLGHPNLKGVGLLGVSLAGYVVMNKLTAALGSDFGPIDLLLVSIIYLLTLGVPDNDSPKKMVGSWFFAAVCAAAVYFGMPFMPGAMYGTGYLAILVLITVGYTFFLYRPEPERIGLLVRMLIGYAFLMAVVFNFDHDSRALGVAFATMVTIFVVDIFHCRSGKAVLFSLLYLAGYAAVCILVLLNISDYFYEAWKVLPIWVGGVIAAAVSTWIFFHGRAKDWPMRRLATSHALAWTCAVALGGFGWFANSNHELVEWTMAEAVSPAKMSSLPDSDLDNFRLLPKARAQDYMRNANGDRTLTVSEPHMSPCDITGKQCWEAAFHLKGWSDGIWYNLLGDTIFEIAAVNPLDVNMNVERSQGFNGFFLAGPQSWVIKAAFFVHNPFSKAQEVLFWRHEDGTYEVLIPYVSYKPTVTGVMIPYLAGVMSVNRFGIINDMWPSTAREKYPNEPFYPVHLAREYAEIVAKWNGGIVGRTITKRDELRISEPENAANLPHFNQAPYVEVYKEGFGWQEVVALEPDSHDGKKLASMLFFDAATGETREYEVPESANINGPRQAMANSMQGNWEAQWSLGIKVEPRPFFKNGHVYYIVGVLTTENNEHPYVHSIVIDGETMKPYPVLNHQELLDLIDRLSRGLPVQQIPLRDRSN